ncbi:MAG: hypothetical protein ABH872_02990 [Candidatus Omnitrophota bacterium]
MKKIIIFILLLLTGFTFTSYAKDKLQVTLFYSPHCKFCLRLKKEFFPKLLDKYKDSIEFKELDIDADEKNLALLFTIGARFGGETIVTPAILVGDFFLSGKEIEPKLEEAINLSLKRKPSHLLFKKKNLVEIFSSISLFTIITAGLIDGINPCAFAVIVFFVSFLAVYGYKKREILVVGSSYCLAVFAAYLLIGLGLFRFLYRIAGFYILIKSFYYLIAAFCFFLAVLALHDYRKYKMTGETGELILQLPKILKKRINIVIGSKLRKNEEQTRSSLSLAISAFTVGLAVSLLEAVCTGQVYVPTIVFILKNTNLRLKALSYLILYNLMFILPLIVVFALSFVGFSSKRFNDLLKKNLGELKLIMFLLFFVLGVLILQVS